MGQFCYTQIKIQFEETPGIFKDETALENALIKYYGDNNISFNIMNINSDRKSSEFEMSSDRITNLKFQLNVLIGYLKGLKIKILGVNSDGFMSMDSCTLDLDELDLDEYDLDE